MLSDECMYIDVYINSADPCFFLLLLHHDPSVFHTFHSFSFSVMCLRVICGLWIRRTSRRSHLFFFFHCVSSQTPTDAVLCIFTCKCDSETGDGGLQIDLCVLADNKPFLACVCTLREGPFLDDRQPSIFAF